MKTNIKLSDLYFDEKIADMVEKNGYIFPPELIDWSLFRKQDITIYRIKASV